MCDECVNSSASEAPFNDDSTAFSSTSIGVYEHICVSLSGVASAVSALSTSTHMHFDFERSSLSPQSQLVVFGT